VTGLKASGGSAVDNDLRAGDAGGGIRGEKRDQRGHLGWIARLAERHPADRGDQLGHRLLAGPADTLADLLERCFARLASRLAREWECTG
jgi:hypothetical protein